MTVVCTLSLKGAPGVTTLSCLVAATWPRTVGATVVEADRAGGDLAARFGLSSTVGWTSLAAAVRRAGTDTPLAPHLQHLPGGLAVLTGARGDQVPDAHGPEAAVARRHPGLVVVDLGRVAPTADGDLGVAGTWLGACDAALLVVPADPAGALAARAHAAALGDATAGRLVAAVVGSGPPTAAELAAFTGIPAAGDVPFDRPAAAVASGVSGAGRRLDRSRLLAAARRIAGTLAALSEPGAAGEDGLLPADAGEPVEVTR